MSGTASMQPVHSDVSIKTFTHGAIFMCPALLLRQTLVWARMLEMTSYSVCVCVCVCVARLTRLCEWHKHSSIYHLAAFAPVEESFIRSPIDTFISDSRSR